MRRRPTDRDGLARDLAGLPELSLDTLKQQWNDLYGNPAPSRLGRALMIRAIAYGLQEKALGGLTAATARQLGRAMEGMASGQVPAASAIKPGTRLLRQWQGITHEVIILDDGVRYGGETFRSLSEVARHITGARWSGPRFFGLKEPRRDRR